MPKLICIDVDGTLVTETQETPASAREAPFGPPSRRATSSSSPRALAARNLPVSWDLGFHGIIAGSGAYVKIGEEVVMDRRMSAEEISYVTDIYRKHGVNWMWQGPDEFCMSEGFFGSFAGARTRKAAPGTPTTCRSSRS